MVRAMNPFHRMLSGAAWLRVAVVLVVMLIALFARPRPSHPASGGPSFGAVESPASGGSAEPNLAVGPDGRVWLSWLEDLPHGGHALRAARLEGERWGTPIDIVSGDSLLGISVDVPALLPMGGVRLAALY